jgi:ATP synthase F1 epsilon subunit
MESKNTIQCIVIAPQGRLLDCEAVSAVFPAHDGYVGILHNHMPMCCELGLGMMEVNTVQKENEPEEKIYVVVDGGFGLVNANQLQIIAKDAYCSKGIKVEKIEHVIEHSKKRLATAEFTAQQRQHETTKNTLLEKLVQLSKFGKPSHDSEHHESEIGKMVKPKEQK